MAFFRGLRYNTPYKKKSTNKRMKGNFKAAKGTKDSLGLVIKCNYSFSAKYDKTNDYGTAIIPIYELLQKSPQFNSFLKLYDQVKINGIRTKLNVVDVATTARDVSTIKSINIVTAWDRTGLSKSQVDFSDGTNLIQPEKWDETPAKLFKPKIGKGIVNATGVNKTILNGYQRWSSSPFLYASTMEEKCCYLPTGNFIDYRSGETTTGEYAFNNLYDGLKPNEFFNDSNPTIPFEVGQIKWKPILMVGVFKSSLGSDNAIIQFDDCEAVLFNGEFTIDVTFRNMKAYV